jgi:hypothetical protein
MLIAFDIDISMPLCRYVQLLIYIVRCSWLSNRSYMMSNKWSNWSYLTFSIQSEKRYLLSSRQAINCLFFDNIYV